MCLEFIVTGIYGINSYMKLLKLYSNYIKILLNLWSTIITNCFKKYIKYYSQSELMLSL